MILEKIKANEISFPEVIAHIEANFEFTPTAFKNGETYNAAGQNSGSCKVFSFAKIAGVSQQETLHCFEVFYNKDVLGNPDGTDHQNIRNFIKYGWDGILFEGEALRAK